ncbi:trypco2 family protein [Nocardia barduliensis]|uniref:trypco2 family protein n=1 Tax=Nocardia TaxID=1817 RepID=UPI0015746F0A|nr:trypco2 family protein [Nocardia barduliensis]
MEIDLAETVEALRAELRKAVLAGEDTEIQFPVTGVQVEFQVGIKKTADGKAGLKFWVVELGTGGGYAAESVQKVILNFGPPVDRSGAPIKIARQAQRKP